MAGAFHGPGEGDCCINVGISGPGVVKRALENEAKGQPFDVVAETIKRTAFKITRVGQLIAQRGFRAAERAVRHRRSLPCAHARDGRFRGAHPRRDGA